MSERVSIIVPLYNSAPFIEETLRSMLAQTYADLAVYVVDDFSTDESPAIVARLAAEDGRVSYHPMPKKGGCPAPTKNEGVRLAKGEYVAFCDHDDWWDPTKLEKQVAYLDAYPEVSVLGCNVEIVDTEHQRSLGLFWHDPADFSPGRVRELALEGPIYATTTCMIMRRSYALSHPFDEQFIGSDEYDLSLHAALDNPAQVALLPEALAFWRWHSSSLSHSGKAAERALRDERAFADKLLARPDLTEEERGKIAARVRMVTRRAGNAELAAGKVAEARKHYREAGDRGSLLMIAMIALSPALARMAVSWKRSHSHARPTFR